MTSPSAKTCIKCGIDCANKPRTKDAQGRYTCKACFDKLAAKQKQAPGPQAAAKLSPRPAAAPLIDDAPDDAAVMAALMADSPSAGSLAESCPSCGAGMIAGSVICTTCGYNKQTGRAMSISKEADSASGRVLSGAAAAAGGVALGSLALVFGVVGACVGGAIGAVIWAVVAANLNMEIGWIAWGIGVLAGLGAAVGARSRAGLLTGLAAAAVAIVAVLAGKYTAIEMSFEAEVKKDSALRSAIKRQVTDEEVLGLIARDVAREHQAAGKAGAWPDDFDPDDALDEEEFPKEVWADASARWAAMDQAARGQWRESVQHRFDAAMQAAIEEAKAEGFFSTFGPFDILWFILAVASAFTIGSGGKFASDD